jgi:ribonuclease G
MAKEMIVSVNGREKKIAILENDQVTEFYIERGEDHQGIVGNIYKGRVMRVLPGMQSAFVDIGLERDAFLYVSDFFDEEEEFERIVMEKGKKGDQAEAARLAAERIEKSRIEREQRMEAAQEKSETLEEIIPAPDLEAITDEDFPAGVMEDETPAEEPAPRGRRRRDRRSRRGEQAESEPSALAEPSSFERIVDDETTAFEDGELFKDALIQERLSDENRAFEFDMEPPVSSASPQFERVADDEDATVTAPAPVVETVVAQAALFVDDADGQSPLAAAPVFERVADEDDAPPAKGSKKGGRDKRPARGGKGKKEAAPAPEPVAETPAEAPPPEEAAPEAKPAKPGRGKKDAGKPKAAAEKKTTSKKGSSSRKKTATTSEDEPLADAEAKVTESAPAAEFATRRGGRRRRRRPNEGEGEGENGYAESEELAAPEPAPVEDTRNHSRSDSRRSGNGRGGRRDRERGERPPTITDLLREGQEIMVQIAKEPIARKGARITSHIALPGRFLVYMPTVEHVGVSRKIESDSERLRLRKLITAIRQEEDVPSGGFIVRTAGVGISEEDLRADARYLVRTWLDMRRGAERAKAPSLVHRDLDLVKRILRDQLANDFAAIRVDTEEEYLDIVEFINLIQPRLVNRVKLYTRETPILEAFGVQEEIDKAIKPRVWLRSGGYLVINQTEALVSIDVNTGKFVGRGNARLEDTITKTNMEAVEEIARQIRLRDLGGIIVLDLIDMEDRRNRQKVLNALYDALQGDKSPTKVLQFNDFGLVIMTRKRVKQSLERTLCAPCSYCQGAGLIKSAQTICYEILEEARRISRSMKDERIKQTTLRTHPEVVRALRSTERDILGEVEDYLGSVDLTSDQHLHQEQFDFAFV